MADIEKIGELVDKAENYAQYGNIDDAPMAALDPRMRIDAMTVGLLELRDALRVYYVEESGQDPWEDDPFLSKRTAVEEPR